MVVDIFFKPVTLKRMNTTYQPTGDGEIPSQVPNLQSGVGDAPVKRIPHKFKYICKSKCKQLALEISKQHKAGKFTRVSEEFLISCEIAVRNHILSKVKSHPSIGKTLM